MKVLKKKDWSKKPKKVVMKMEKIPLLTKKKGRPLDKKKDKLKPLKKRVVRQKVVRKVAKKN